MTKKIKVAISGVDPYNGNRGVGALAISTMFLLNEIAREHKSGIEIYLIGPNFGPDRIEIANESIKFFNVLLISAISSKKLLKLIVTKKGRDSLLSYLKFDYILCLGAGDSFSDIYGERRFKSINAQHKVARLLGKKYLLLPQTIGPFNSNSVKQKANRSIEKAQVVLTRDFRSLQYVINNTLQKNVFEVIDVAFFMPYKKQKFSTKHTHVGINISALLWHGGYTRNNQFGLKSDYQELIHDIIRYFLSLPNVKIHIVPHVVSQNSSLENDYEVAYHLVNAYSNERIILSPFFLTPVLAKNYIAGLDFFAGARMHATIAAFSSGVPVFPMAYSRKFNGLFNDTLNYKYMGDMVNEEKEDILKGIKEAFKNKEELKAIIQDRMAGVIEGRKLIITKYLSDFLKVA